MEANNVTVDTFMGSPMKNNSENIINEVEHLTINDVRINLINKVSNMTGNDSRNDMIGFIVNMTINYIRNYLN